VTYTDYYNSFFAVFAALTLLAWEDIWQTWYDVCSPRKVVA